MQYSRYGLMSADLGGIKTSLSVLAMLLLIQPGTLLLPGTRLTHVTLISTNTPGSFSTDLLPIRFYFSMHLSAVPALLCAEAVTTKI